MNAFQEIRRMYETTDLSACGPYPMDWLPMFSPIERATWGEIRMYGLPFWPQYPIGPFFADFADPVKQIVIECDGAAFHKDKAKDKRRDEFMNNCGWTVYRLPGSVCNKRLPSPAEIIEDAGFLWRENAKCIQGIREWYLETVDGFIAALAERHYSISIRYGENIRGRLTGDLIGEAIGERMAL